jgi:hypothetical protein
MSTKSQVGTRPYELPGDMKLGRVNLVRLQDSSNLPSDRLGALLPTDLGHGLLHDRRQTHANAIGHPKHQFHRWISQITLHQAEHGFRDAASLGDGVIRELAAFPRFSQEPDNLFADGFIMSDSGHAESLQKRGLDTYFAMVKYRRTTQKRPGARPMSCLAPSDCEYIANKFMRKIVVCFWQTVLMQQARINDQQQ